MWTIDVTLDLNQSTYIHTTVKVSHCKAATHYRIPLGERDLDNSKDAHFMYTYYTFQ